MADRATSTPNAAQGRGPGAERSETAVVRHQARDNVRTPVTALSEPVVRHAGRLDVADLQDRLRSGPDRLRA